MPKLIYKFRSFDNVFWEQIFKEKRLYMAPVKDLNDPFEGELLPIYTSTAGDSIVLNMGKFNKNARNYLSKYKVLSMAANIRSKAMWAYYASDYKGFAIEFNTQGVMSKLNKVIYKPPYIDVVPHQPVNVKQLNSYVKNALLYKSMDWSHEGEYRFISEDAYFNFDLTDIESVILGCKVIPENVDKIKKYTSKMNIKVKYVYTVPIKDTIEFYYDGTPPRGDGTSYKKYIINNM